MKKEMPLENLIRSLRPALAVHGSLALRVAHRFGQDSRRLERTRLAHVPRLGDRIRAALSGGVALYDGSDGTARETLRQLVRRGWVRGGSRGTVTLENSRPSELPLSRRLLALPRED